MIVPSILIVDDQQDSLYDLSLILATAGFDPLTAADGTEALIILQTEPVDLILSEINLPNMDGYQLYQRIRENPDWTMIPFLFLTARRSDSDIRYGKALGVDDYLVKPIGSKALLSTVQGKLRRAQQLTCVENIAA